MSLSENDPAAFNLVAGTQTFGPKYQFTRQHWLVETAVAIRDMGSNLLKFALEPAPTRRPLTQLARDEPVYRQVLDMPFSHYLLWVYGESLPDWKGRLTREKAGAVYQETYDLARYLLERYRSSGKRFFLGHWEGDWHLRPDYDRGKEPDPARVSAFTEWLRTRQRAVEDARRADPAEGVAVYHYTEVNLVRIAMQGGKALVNTVLPQVPVDYVSYSSYDSLDGQGEAMRATMRSSLDYIESMLPKKPDVPGRRVFIGEYGFPAESPPRNRRRDAGR